MPKIQYDGAVTPEQAAKLKSAFERQKRIQEAEEAGLMEFTDEDGLHVMCACGHYVSGGVKTGDKRAMCPNCMFLIRFKQIPIVYPEQLPEDLREQFSPSVDA